MDRQDRLPVLLKDLEDRTQSFAALLPANVNPARFVSAAKTALLQNPKLVACDRRSIIQACMRCAIDGLVPDGREAVVIDGWGKQGPAAQYWIMTQGMLALAYRSGRVLKVEARIVYEGDSFGLRYGTDAAVEHHPAFKDRGGIVGCYAIAILAGGQVLIEYMDKEEIDGIRKRSKNPKGPWESDYAEMARKTLIRRLFKALPKEAGSADNVTETAHDAELLVQPIRHPSEARDGGTRFTSGIGYHPEAPEGELDPLDVAQAEQAADIDPEPAADDESRREEKSRSGRSEPEESEVTRWKRRLRELREALAVQTTADAVEQSWTSWDTEHHPPADVTERAKQLVDERLGALAYTKASGG